MDSIKLVKYQAIKRYKYNSCSNFLPSLIQYSLLVVILGLFLSSPLWLPTLAKLFFVESLPKVLHTALGPKCLFLVFNLIVIFLVFEYRLSSSSPKPDIYEEYVAHAQRHEGVSVSEEKGNEGTLTGPSVNDTKKIERVEELKEELEEELQEELEEEEEREERGLPAEELNRRVEEFIARVNMQRMLEERMLVCCCG